MANTQITALRRTDDVAPFVPPDRSGKYDHFECGRTGKTAYRRIGVSRAPMIVLSTAREIGGSLTLSLGRAVLTRPVYKRTIC